MLGKGLTVLLLLMVRLAQANPTLFLVKQVRMGNLEILELFQWQQMKFLKGLPTQKIKMSLFKLRFK